MNIDLNEIVSTLEPFSDSVEGNHTGKAAVLVPLVQKEGCLNLVLTRRVMNMRHHGGEVAFPGGMWESGDYFPVKTALREAEEEIALNDQAVQVLGVLPKLYARNATEVIPVVAIMDDVPLKPAPEEVEAIFYVPIETLLADSRLRTDVFTYKGQSYWVPAYEYEGYEIWGFTAGVIKTLLERCFGARFIREHSAPEKIW